MQTVKFKSLQKFYESLEIINLFYTVEVKLIAGYTSIEMTLLKINGALI